MKLRATLKHYDTEVAKLVLDDNSVLSSEVVDTTLANRFTFYDLTERGFTGEFQSRRLPKHWGIRHLVGKDNPTLLEELLSHRACDVEDGFWVEFEEPYNKGFRSYYDVLRAGGAMS
jgi:hypothetical protein